MTDWWWAVWPAAVRGKARLMEHTKEMATLTTPCEAIGEFVRLMAVRACALHFADLADESRDLSAAADAGRREECSE